MIRMSVTSATITNANKIVPVPSNPQARGYVANTEKVSGLTQKEIYDLAKMAENFFNYLKA